MMRARKRERGIEVEGIKAPPDKRRHPSARQASKARNAKTLGNESLSLSVCLSVYDRERSLKFYKSRRKSPEVEKIFSERYDKREREREEREERSREHVVLSSSIEERLSCYERRTKNYLCPSSSLFLSRRFNPFSFSFLPFKRI